jgi:hypothetical protein
VFLHFAFPLSPHAELAVRVFGLRHRQVVREIVILHFAFPLSPHAELAVRVFGLRHRQVVRAVVILHFAFPLSPHAESHGRLFRSASLEKLTLRRIPRVQETKPWLGPTVESAGKSLSDASCSSAGNCLTSPAIVSRSYRTLRNRMLEH